MIRWLLRLLYPPKCVFCGTLTRNERFAVCSDCLPTLSHNKRACQICGTPLDTVYGDLICTDCRRRKPAFSRAYVPFIYQDAVRTAILRFKFAGRRAGAGTFAAYMLMKLREMEAERPDLITFVPMHFIRLGMRGYNQAALLARALGKMLDVPVAATLRKTKHTQPQSKRRGRDRLYAPRKAYALRKDAAVSGKRILLVDDVITTGATLDTCARLLKNAGAKNVDITTVAATTFV